MSIKTRNVVFKFDAEAKNTQAKLDKLAKDLEKVEKQYQEAKEGSLEWYAAQRKLIQIQKELGQATAQSSTATNNWTQTMKRAGNAIAALGGIATIGVLVSDATTKIIDFDQSLADLSAITGATGGDLEFLENRAKEFGRTTTVSAIEAVEAFKLVGSAKPELLANGEALASVTAEAITLSEAAGFDLPTAAANLGSALNALSLPADEAGRVVNVLAAASQKGAREIPFVTDAFSKFGGVAAQAGVSIEESAAAVEVLGAKIPEASIVGTNLRGILIRLQVAAQENGREFLGLRGELDLLGDSVNDVVLLKELFGQENLLAAQTLIAEREALGSLTEAITDTNAAYEQAETRTSTLRGSLLRLRNAWESIVLRFTSGSNTASKAVRFLADNLSTILRVLAAAATAVISYRVAVQGVAIAQNASKVATAAYTTVKALFTAGTNAATVATKAFNTAVKANPIGLLVSGLATAVALLWDFGDAQENVEETTKDANAELREQARLIRATKDEIVDIISFIQDPESGFTFADLAKFERGDIDAAIDQLETDIQSALARIDQQEIDFPIFIRGESEQEFGERLNAIVSERFGATSLEADKLFAAVSNVRKDLADLDLLQEEVARREALRNSQRIEDNEKLEDAIKPNTIAALQAEVQTLRDDVVKEFELGSDGFADAVEKYVDKSKELEEAQKSLRATSGNFEEGSLNALKAAVSSIRKEVEATDASSEGFEDLVSRLREAKAELDELTKRINGTTTAEVDTEKLALTDLSEAERNQIALANIAQEGELRILDLKLAFAKARLDVLRESGKAETQEYQKQVNAIEELEAQRSAIVARSNEQQIEFEREKTIATLDGVQQILNATVASTIEILNLKVAEVDQLIGLQQNRVNEARDIADQGNAELLELEQERLDKLNQQRERFVRTQQALAATQLVAESALAIAKAAAAGGPAAPFTIAATLIALTAGLAQARALASQAAFFKGGYTGDGSPYEESTAVGSRPYIYHKKEFVMDHVVTGIGRNKEIFDWILKGRVDLAEAFNQRNVIVNAGGASEEKMNELITTIRNKPVSSLYLSKKGVVRIVTETQRKTNRIKSKL